MGARRQCKTIRWILLVLALLIGAGVAFYILQGPSPAVVAARFCAAWKAGDSRAMTLASSTSSGTAKIKTAAGSFDIPDLAKHVKFKGLKISGPESVSEDIATVPATAQIDGGPTAEALASQLPVEIDPALLKNLAASLNKPFTFTIGVVKQKNGWKVDQQATFINLGDALQQDPAVKRAGLAIFQNALPSLLGERVSALDAA